MATDTERSYQGTNFAVTTLVVLLVLVGGYFAVANIADMYDDPSQADLSNNYGGSVQSDISSH